jgi:hypothetical protein
MRFPLHSERFSPRPPGRRPVRLSVVACLSLVGAAVCAVRRLADLGALPQR